MKYLSVCSGIEAASVAWRPLGWEPVAFAEIGPFPCAVLKHHYPEIPNLGDMTRFPDWREYYGTVDLIVAGTPCQDFSIAGHRAGLAGERGKLALAFAQVLSVVRPEWLVWENVPGVFSTNGGRDFGAFLRALDDIGYSCSWRVLDAQYFGVPQRRRRVFVVGHLGDWRPAAAVLFESESVRGNTSSCGPAGSGDTESVTRSVGSGGGEAGAHRIVSCAVTAKWKKGTSGPSGDEYHNLVPVMFTQNGTDTISLSTITRSLTANSASCASRRNAQNILFPDTLCVRRLTPVEVERLQGFPDGYTDIPYKGNVAPDSLRYEALGNSMAVPVMRWIGERIEMKMKNPGQSDRGKRRRKK